MDDDLFLISDIENEYKKLCTETKKKYPKIKEFVDFSLKTIEKIKSTIASPNSSSNISQMKKKFQEDLHLSMDIILKPIIIISEGKYSKLNFSSVLILKKLITYNYITEKEYNNIIKILKDMYDNSNEDTQLKILETLQSLISINVSKISEETLNNIMIIFCRIFCFKNIETKNAIQLILGTFMKKIFDYCDNETIVNLLKNLILLSESSKKDWINNNSISGKCLGLELITTIIETFHDKLKKDIFKNILIDDVKILLQKLFAMNIDHPIIGIKACRLTVAIINNLNILYDLIEGLIKFIGKSNQIAWQKVIGLESLSELFKNHKFLYGLFKSNKILYEKVLISFSDTTYQSFMLKSKNSGNLGEPNSVGAGVNIPLLRKQSDSLYKMPNKKYLTNNLIINDENIVITQNINYVYKLIIECFLNLRNSYVTVLEEKNINVNVNTLDQIKKEQKAKNINKTVNETEKELQEMICTQFVNIKGGLICIFIHFNDINTIQNFISIMQTFIYIFSSFDLDTLRDELLDDLCKLAIPNNLENIFEVKEKNILIIRAIFNLIHCINLLDYSSWLILIETIQNLYFILIKSSSYLYNHREQFNINIVLNNLVNNIKKYSYSTDLVEIEKIFQENENNNTSNANSQTVLPELNTINKEHKQKFKSSVIVTPANKEVLSEEQKENIEILSNVVNTLFIESNGYDDDSLITIIKALYNNTKRIFDDYIKEKKETKKIIKDNNTGATNNLNNNLDNKKIVGISNKTELQKKDTGGVNVNTNAITNKDFAQPQVNVVNANTRFMPLNGVLTAVQAKIMNNLNYALGNFTNTSSYSNVAQNSNTNNNNNLNINNSAAVQNEKLLANLTYINFNLVKLLCLTIININRVHLFWNIIIDTVNLLCSNSMNNRFSNTLSKFTIEILIQIIITIITQYKYNEKNNDNQQFNDKELQITIFKPIFSFLNRHHNLSFVLEPLQKIIEKCSTKLNALGWNSFINILNQILSNGKVDSQQCESVFKIVEQIFNEYTIYLNIFNIEHILNILEIFSVSKDNNNICYSSISYFWQCANICEDYQKGKKNISEKELELFNDIKFSSENEKNVYFGNIWKNIFFKLININNDERFDIRKSGINVFSQFYVAKIKSMNSLYDKENDKNRKISAEIIYELFFEIVNKNFKNYLNNAKYKSAQELKDLEDTVVLTLQSIGKVIKCFVEENKTEENKEANFEENNKIFLTYINKCIDLMKINTPLISMNILKNLLDIESIDEKLFLENLSSNWKIFNEIGNYIVDENIFLKDCAKTVDGAKLVEVLVDTLKTIYLKLLTLEIKEKTLNYEIEKLINYFPKIFLSLSYTEFNFIKANPKVLLNTERNIFELIEELGKKIKDDTLISTIKYLITFIIFDLEKPHSEILCRRSFESIGVIFTNENIHLISNEEMSKIILNIVNMVVPIIKGRGNNDIIAYMIKNKKKNEIYIWNYLINNLLNNILEPIIFDIKDQIIIDKLIILFNEFLNENQEIYKNIKEPYINEIYKINREMETSVINFIINNLFKKSLFMDKELQKKILSLLEIESPEKNKSNNNEIFSFFPINKFEINSLFQICKFNQKDEINKDLDTIRDHLNKLQNKNTKNTNENISDKYIEVRTNISKKSMPILLKKCKEEMKKYLENIKEKSDNEYKKERIKYILENLKNLDYIYNEEDEKNCKNQIMKECLKSKKGHLFMLHLNLSEFISIQDNDIRNIIQDIFNIISQEIGLNKDN